LGGVEIDCLTHKFVGSLGQNSIKKIGRTFTKVMTDTKPLRDFVEPQVGFNEVDVMEVSTKFVD
jgi:hypothetical protein